MLRSINSPVQEDTARTFLMNRNILRETMTCPCTTPPTDMLLISCTSSKSSDLFIWKCPACKSFKNIRTDSVLFRKNLSFTAFLSQILYLSIASRLWPTLRYQTLLDFQTRLLVNGMPLLLSLLNANAKPLGGPGKIVEIDEAKFGKRKYNKGAYREGMWVLGGVDRETGECFLVPCPGQLLSPSYRGGFYLEQQSTVIACL